MRNPLSIEAGKRRHVVQIQRQNTTQDAMGGQIEVWTTIRTTWASIVYLAVGSKENYQPGAFSSQVTHIITILATPAPPIKPGMRVVFGSHVYLIQPFDDVQLQGVKLNLQCIEIAASQEASPLDVFLADTSTGDLFALVVMNGAIELQAASSGSPTPVLLADTVTGTNYRVVVTNGEALLEPSGSAGVVNISFTDTVTGLSYGLQVTNGALECLAL